MSLPNLRPKVKSILPDHLIKFLPSHLIDYAIHEAIKAYKSASSNRFKNGHKRTINTKSGLKLKKKANIETITIEACYFRGNTIFKTILGPLLKTSIPLIQFMPRDSKLSFKRNTGNWFLNVPIERKKLKKKTNIKIDDVCALDPGIRKFQTMYSTKGCAFLGTDFDQKQLKRCKVVDNIVSKMTKSNHKKRQSLKKVLHRKIQEIKNHKNELHWKICNFLVNNYQRIIIPKFEGRKMVRTLSHKISRSLYNAGHYQFRERLTYKCDEYGVQLDVVTEEYTSKTCTNCGVIQNIGTSEVYNCKSCNMTLDRDINGARNIFLKCY